MNGEEDLTNNKVVKTFLSNNKCTHSTSRYYNGEFIWQNKVPHQYEIKGNELTENFGEDGTLRLSKVTSINEATLCYHSYKIITPEGGEKAENANCNFHKVTADYSQDIIGMWEGVEMTGDETYGDANHRIEYKADGTYTYYDKVGDSWVPSKNAGNEYNVDGDWLATRWQPTEGADYEYEWWDIDEITDGTMKWSALREKGDKTRYTTTFTWKKVNLPTQEEIETKIIGKWKTVKTNGKDTETNARCIQTYYPDNTEECSMSWYDATRKTYFWDYKKPFTYEINGNISIETPILQDKKVLGIIDISSTTMNAIFQKVILPDGSIIPYNVGLAFQKVSADYSETIIGLWEGVEMTGDETYGDANHRIYYKEDGTYTYYDKVGDSWVPSKNAGNEYNVDGDWLATRWQPTEGADYEYEWWDIDEIKDGTMKWSALREKGDGTRYAGTFTWKKVQLQ